MKEDIIIQISVPNQTRYLSLIGKFGEIVAREIDRFSGDREAFAHHINVVLTEAMVNVIKHANANDPGKEVQIRISISKRELVIRVYDSGQGFDLGAIPAPCPDTDPLEEKGRGLFIIRSLMDSVVYKNAEGGNVLEMRKIFN